MDTAVSTPDLRRDHVVCLHSSLSSSRQWQTLAQRLEGEFNLVTPDLLGYGEAPSWPADGDCSLEREIERLADIVAELEGPIHLVGHSYGGAVAIRATRAFGRRISSLALYEPVIFPILFDESSDPVATLEMIRLIEGFKRDYDRGELLQAARGFVDFWSGAGTWDTIPFDKQLRLAARTPAVLANFEAIMAQQNPLSTLAPSGVATLYLCGEDSPACARAIGEQFARQVPDAMRQRFRAMGHMGPITHAETVNARIERFIRHRSAQQYRQDYAWAA